MGDSLLLRLRNATVIRSRQTLFSELNLEIRKNQSWAVVGETGSGKSSLLQTLAGKYRLTSGELEYFGNADDPENRRAAHPFANGRPRAVYVDIRHEFQPLAGAGDFYYQQRFNAGYADSAPTVADYLAQKAHDAPSGASWRLKDLYTHCNLVPIRDRQLIKLSSGESKRLRMAAALIQNPDLLLLDCPLAGLDADTRDIFEELFYKIKASGICLIMATNPDQIPAVVTHVAALDKNRSLNTCTRREFSPPGGIEALRVPGGPGRLKRLMDPGPRQRFDVLVAMENIQVAYGNSVVLENIYWQIRQGERWALSGPNGSGKSTLLSLINGDHPQAYANDILLFDCKRGSGESIWDIKKKIGFMSPELFQFFPSRFTCRQAVESGFHDTLGLLKKSRKKERALAEEWMEIMGLSELKHRPFPEASAGQQRLCLLARALVKIPYLLLLDEPCQGLDRAQQQRFVQLIDAIAATSDLALVYVTHQSEQLPACIRHTLHLPNP